MKKMLHLALAAAMVLAASCSKDNDFNGPAGEGNGTMTFELKGLNKVTTYAAVPVKTAAESDIVGAVSVYMFKASDNTLVKAYTTGGTDCALSGQKITISNLKNYMGQQMNFYVVANPTPTTAITLAAGATEADLLDKLTKPLTNDGTYITEKLITPLLLTGKTTASVEVSASASASISLKRSVARFDVVNPMADFIIDEIYVSDAKEQGYVFPRVALPTVDSKSMKAFAGPVTADYETIASERIARSVFYTYPTKMGETSITVKAHFGAAGTPKMYAVNSDKDILANSRYKIVCQEVNGQVELSLVVLEWDEAEELPLEEVAEGNVTLDGFAASDGASLSDLTGFDYNFTDDNGGTLTFVADSKYGTTYSVEYSFGEQSNLDTDIAVAKSTVTTYSFATKDTYTVTLPRISNDHSRSGLAEIKLHISAVNDPTKTAVVRFYHNYDITMSPNSPLAYYIDDNVPGIFAGYITLDVARNTNDISLVNVAGLTSIEDLGNMLPCLTSLNFESMDFGNIILDFSGLPNLEALNFGGVEGVTAVDLSNNTNLRSIYISDLYPITEIDLSNNTLLEEAYIYNYIGTLDLSNNTRLTTLDWSSINMSLLDISGCRNLTSLQLNGNPMQTLNMYVWSDFPVGDPDQQFSEYYAFTDVAGIEFITTPRP